MTNDDALNEAIELLSNSRSPKRRSGAKRLRKLGDERAGPALMEALKREMKDARTWETQYQMIVALGACQYVDALEYFRELANEEFEATMIYVALGDAITRLSGPIDEHAETVMAMVQSGNADLADGALRAMAMQRAVPGLKVIESLIKYVTGFDVQERQRSNRRFWVAAAAPGWLDISPQVRPFLADCAKSKNTGLRDAATKALDGKYKKYSPL